MGPTRSWGSQCEEGALWRDMKETGSLEAGDQPVRRHRGVGRQSLVSEGAE